MLRRRELLKGAVVLATGQLSGANLLQAATPSAVTGTGQPKPFDYAWLKGQARYLASVPYAAAKDAVPAAMTKLGYDQYNSLRFRTERSLWADAGTAFRLSFFHVGRGFAARRMYEIVDGQAREILYDTSMFEFDKAGI